MTKILLFVGTRPEAIKLVPLYLQLKQRDGQQVETKLMCTGQHREMVNQILEYFGIEADLDLDLMTQNQSLATLTAVAISRIDEVLEKESPDLIVVQGDTSTAFCASLAGFYKGTKVAHVEAGLRTHDINSPFPEEANRQFISKIADLHFAATEGNRQNLLNEGVNEENIVVTGNTVIDTLFLSLDKLKTDNGLQEELRGLVDKAGYKMEQRPFVLITGHRRESFGTGFKNICKALAVLAENFPELDWVYPVHLNPNVREVVFRELDAITNFYLLPPMDYGTFVYMLQQAKMVLTDSGGIQEEAPSLKKPTFVMREKTERMEGIERNLVKLVGTDSRRIIQEVSVSLERDFEDFDWHQSNPYGDGKAAARICKCILDSLEQ